MRSPQHLARRSNIRSRRRRGSVVIFSLEHDLHAYAVLHKLREYPHIDSHLVTTDVMARHGGLHWEHDGHSRGEIKTNEGDWLDLRTVDVAWWRRVNQAQKYLPRGLAETAIALVDNEWRAGLFGCVTDVFRGTWVNPPAADVTAGNKLVQLSAATRRGLPVPRTIVSQDPDRVQQFCSEMGGVVIAKKLLGAGGLQLATLELTNRELRNKRSIRLCPTIYQEKIVGSQHIRATCFGREVHAIRITSQILDWRRDLSVLFESISLNHKLKLKLLGLLGDLELKMGVMDLKLRPDGTPVWLELNTQGQFLFAEALSGHDLTSPFAHFLANEARARD